MCELSNPLKQLVVTLNERKQDDVILGKESERLWTEPALADLVIGQATWDTTKPQDLLQFLGALALVIPDDRERACAIAGLWDARIRSEGFQLFAQSLHALVELETFSFWQMLSALPILFSRHC